MEGCTVHRDCTECKKRFTTIVPLGSAAPTLCPKCKDKYK